MCASAYSEEQIKRYLDILHNYTNQTVDDGYRKPKCCNCQRSDCFLFIQVIKFAIPVVA